MTRILRHVAPLALAVLLIAAPRGEGQGEPGIDALRQELDAAVAAFIEDYRQAPEAEQKAMLADPAREPRHRFVPRFQVGADRFSGRGEERLRTIEELRREAERGGSSHGL